VIEFLKAILSVGKTQNNTFTKFILVNLSDFSLEKIQTNPNLEGIIDFSKKNNNTFTSFCFLNNPDKSMRWIFPTKSKSPAFLNLYNGSGIKAIAFESAVKFLHFIGWVKPISSGKFSIFSIGFSLTDKATN